MLKKLAFLLFVPALWTSQEGTSLAESVVPSRNYIPTASEFSSEFVNFISEITARGNLGNKERQQIIANELLGQTETELNRSNLDERYFLAAYAKKEAKDYPGAIELFRKSLEYRESNPVARLLLAYLLKDTNNCNAALMELDQVKFLLGSEPADGYLARAECLAELNRQEEAEQMISAGRKAFPGNLDLKKLSLKFKTLTVANGVQLDESKTAELDGDLPELAASNPNDSAIQLVYVKSLLRKGDILTKRPELELAEKIARAEFEKTGQAGELAAKLLFSVLLKQRKYQEIEELIKTLEQNIPNSPLVSNSKKQFEIEREGLKVLKYNQR